MRVELSEAALRDLMDIALYVASDHPGRAHSFVDELYEACADLADQPHRFAVVPGLTTSRYRRRPYGRYAIIYDVAEDAVSIIRIISSAMNLNYMLD